MPMPARLFPVLLADPAWRFKVFSESGTSRSADNHYPTMTVEAIAALKIPAAADAVLFLWATVPMLLQALQVMQAWGFTYRSHLAWVKDRPGCGFWVRNKHELLLIGARGRMPAPRPSDRPESVIEAAVRQHSEKPERAYEIIEHAYPTLPKIELFARARRPGWEAWGNEVPPQPDAADLFEIPGFLRRSA